MLPAEHKAFGNGFGVLLLPALSSISTREEMQPLARHLDNEFITETRDWPGFGTKPRPHIEWTPEILSDFLRDSIRRQSPAAVIAAGHAAAYAVYELAQRPGGVACLVLVAPTWRGPLPTMMGGSKAWFRRIVGAFDNKVMGPLLYRLNVSPWMVRKMALEHVYSNATWLTEARFQSKIAVTKAKGARHSSVRFVTGSLDRYADRDPFLNDLRRVGCPVLIVYGAETPRRSRIEMELMSMLEGVTTVVMEKGKLALHEEFPSNVAAEVMRFFNANLPARLSSGIKLRAI